MSSLTIGVQEVTHINLREIVGLVKGPLIEHKRVVSLHYDWYFWGLV
jgi:hypothetical protein